MATLFPATYFPDLAAYLNCRVVVSADGCWEWQGCLFDSGYGQSSSSQREKHGTGRVHRLGFLATHGHAPPLLRHSCDNRICCNPAHLTPGTNAENIRDRDERGRAAIGPLNGAAKLTASDVLEIRASNLSQRRLGREHGVGQSTICDILAGRTWAHLDKATPFALSELHV